MFIFYYVRKYICKHKRCALYFTLKLKPPYKNKNVCIDTSNIIFEKLFTATNYFTLSYVLTDSNP